MLQGKHVSLKKRLGNGDVLIGTFIKLNAPAIPEMLGYAGFDFIIVDGEHGNFSYNEMMVSTLAANSVGMASIIRVPNAMDENILHSLDIGSQGVMVPNLTSVEQAVDAVRKMKYYPLGERGYSLTTRGANYTFCDEQEYVAYENQEVLSVVMVENTFMAENHAKLCQIPEIDVLFIGPSDLSQSLGVPGQIKSQLVQDYIKKTIEQIVSHGKIAGIFASSVEDAERYLEWGAKIIACTTDINMIANKFKEVGTAVQKIKDKRC